MDERPVRAAVDRLAQAADVHVDEIALRVEMQVPHALEQHGARYDLPGAAHQEFEQLQLPRGEVDVATAAGDRPREQVELEVSHPQLRGLRHAGAPARQSLDAGEQLGGSEGL